MTAYNATLSARQDCSTDAAFFHVKADAGPLPEFKPGQFVTIGLSENPGDESPREDALVRRPYSLANAEGSLAEAELFISRVDDGDLTQQLWQLTAGSRVWMDQRIKGTFTLEPVPRGLDLLMISTGTGVVPYVSMLRSYRGTDRWRRFVLVNGARSSAELGFHEELLRMADEDPSLTYLPVVSREPEASGWRGLRGRVQEALTSVFDEPAGNRVVPDRCHAFVCGNPDMIGSVSELLQARGFQTGTSNAPGNLHFEKYWN